MAHQVFELFYIDCITALMPTGNNLVAVANELRGRVAAHRAGLPGGNSSIVITTRNNPNHPDIHRYFVSLLVYYDDQGHEIPTADWIVARAASDTDLLNSTVINSGVTAFRSSNAATQTVEYSGYQYGKYLPWPATPRFSLFEAQNDPAHLCDTSD